jgi:hypothetical protein
LQRPSPDEALRVVAKGEKRDQPPTGITTMEAPLSRAFLEAVMDWV